MRGAYRKIKSGRNCEFCNEKLAVIEAIIFPEPGEDEEELETGTMYACIECAELEDLPTESLYDVKW